MVASNGRPFEGKRILVTGGNGSFGRALVHRLLQGELGRPAAVVVFSRNASQHEEMRNAFLHAANSPDSRLRINTAELLEFRAGDLRRYEDVVSALEGIDLVINSAALKDVPTCEYSPSDAVETNIRGPENLIRAIKEQHPGVQAVLAVSTDQACKPMSVMGMTKAIQERLFIRANIDIPTTRFVCVRFGNVLGSRGSVLPLFHRQIIEGRPVTVTDREMTRFILTVDEAVESIVSAYLEARTGETYIRKMPAIRIDDLARVLIGDREIEIRYIGIRPGEKLHDTLVTEEEIRRTVERAGHFVVLPILPELRKDVEDEPLALTEEYRSKDHCISASELRDLLQSHGLLEYEQFVAAAGLDL